MTTEEMKTPPVSAEPPRKAPKKRKKKMNKAVKNIIAVAVTLAVVAAIGFAIWYFLFREEEELGDILPATAQIGSIQSTVQGSGNARAGGNAALTTTAKGTVQQVYVATGDQVTEGQPLYDMNSPEAEEQVEKAKKDIADQEKLIKTLPREVTAAEKAVKDAQKAYEAKQKEFQEYDDVVQEKLDAVEDAKDALEDARDGVEDAKDAVEDAKEAVQDGRDRVEEDREALEDRKEDVEKAREEAQEKRDDLERLRQELSDLNNSFEKLTVRAPFAGKITEAEDIGAGQVLEKDAKVATFVNDRRFKMALYFSRAYADSVYVGQAATVSLPSTMDTLTGTVDEIHMINYISPEGASFFEAVIAVDNPGSLTAGMAASASMTAADGSAIYSYESGTLEYYETADIVTELPGTVTAIGTLLKYSEMEEGDVFLIQDRDGLDKLISDKQDEVEQGEEAVKAADDAIEAAEKAVKAAEKTIQDDEDAIGDLEDAVEDAEKGVKTAEKNVKTAEKAVKEAEEAVEEARTDGYEDMKDQVQEAKDAVDLAKEGVEDAKQAIADGDARLAELQEALVTAQNNLLNFNATAPISGTVTSCTIDVGQEVDSGTTVVTISDTTNMIVEITVDDRNIPFVTPGMTVELSDWNGNSYMGEVTKIDMENSEMSGSSGMTTYPVTLSVENYSGTLLQGMWLDYSFVTSESTDCLLVPIQCVKSIVDTDGNAQTVVFLHADSEPENAVSFEPPEEDPYSYSSTKYPTPEEGYWPVPVETGLSDRYSVEIVSGLNEGDEVFQAYTMTGAYS